ILRWNSAALTVTASELLIILISCKIRRIQIVRIFCKIRGLAGRALPLRRRVGGPGPRLGRQPPSLHLPVLQIAPALEDRGCPVRRNAPATVRYRNVVRSSGRSVIARLSSRRAFMSHLACCESLA